MSLAKKRRVLGHTEDGTAHGKWKARPENKLLLGSESVLLPTSSFLDLAELNIALAPHPPRGPFVLVLGTGRSRALSLYLLASTHPAPHRKHEGLEQVSAEQGQGCRFGKQRNVWSALHREDTEVVRVCCW